MSAPSATAAQHTGSVLPLRKYLAVAGLGLRQAAAERLVVIARLTFYGVILLVFSRLWFAVLEHSPLPGIGPAECLWYLAITEWVVLTQPPIYLQIERDVRNGDVAYQVARPVSYVAARLAEALGEVAFRMLAMGPVGLLLAHVLADGLPGQPNSLWFALPLGILAGLLQLLFHTIIGLSAFWLQDVSPAYWIWQKLSFVLGGLLLPLEIYPAWLRTIALASPFSAMLYGPGRAAFGLSFGGAAEVAARLLAWIACAAILLIILHQRGLRRLEINGG